MASSRKSASASQEWVNPGKTPQEVSAHHFKRKLDLLTLEQLITLRQEMTQLRCLIAEMNGSRAQHRAAILSEQRLQKIGL